MGGFKKAMLAVTLTVAILPVLAQQGGTARYVYDDNGRLRAVISPSGEAAVYDYDAAGNFIAIRRLAVGALELFSFSPRKGPVGTLVTFSGVGLGTGVSSVAFNGSTARIVSSNATTIVAEVPEEATTGLVTIVTSHGTVTTSEPFTVKGVGVKPGSVTLVSGQSFQFTASVSGLGFDSDVKWKVNSIEGGNTTVGTISSSGLYTAASLPNVQSENTFIIRASSEADPTFFSEARARVLNTNFVTEGVSRGILVEIPRSNPPGNVNTVGAISKGLLIEIPGTVSLGSVNQASAVSKGVMVEVLRTVPIGVANEFAGISKGILVEIPGSNPPGSVPQVAGFSRGVLVEITKPVINGNVSAAGAVSLGILIQNNATTGNFSPFAAFSKGILIERPLSIPPGGVTEAGAISRGILIENPRTVPLGGVANAAAISKGVLVEIPMATPQSGVTDVSTISRGILVERSSPLSPGIASIFASASPGILITNVPDIAAISPNGLKSGVSITITITGANLAGVNGLSFVNSTGALVNSFRVKSLTVNGTGTSLTANISVDASAPTGQYLVMVTTAATHSSGVRTNQNTIAIIP